jgi:hypothetical protein
MNVKQITTLERQNNIQKQVERLKDLEPQLWMRCKDAPLVRLEAKYHQKCMVLFMKRQSEKDERLNMEEVIAGELLDKLHCRFLDGRIYSASELKLWFEEALSKSGISMGTQGFRTLKKKLLEKYGTSVEISALWL